MRTKYSDSEIGKFAHDLKEYNRPKHTEVIGRAVLEGAIAATVIGVATALGTREILQNMSFPEVASNVTAVIFGVTLGFGSFPIIANNLKRTHIRTMLRKGSESLKRKE